jgi:hypothetical protein
MQTRVFDFSITIFENPTGRYRAIHTSFVREYRRNFSNTPEQIKIDLIRNCSKLPNPVTLTVESEYVLPFEETLLPIAKRSVVKYLGREA